MIQKRLIDRLALRLLEGELAPGDRVRVDAAAGGGDLAFEKIAAAPPEPAVAY